MACEAEDRRGGRKAAAVDGGQAPGLFSLCAEPSGIITTSVRGFWSLADADMYFARLEESIAACRRRGGQVRVLVDRRSSPVQSPDVAARMQRANRELYGEGDRLAIVVGSNLARMQIQRLFGHGGSRAFLSVADAEHWLMVAS